MERYQNAYETSVGKSERMRILGRHKCRWENDTKIDLKGIAWEGVGVYPSGSGQVPEEAVVNTAMNSLGA
jgi:hypothetical protein